MKLLKFVLPGFLAILAFISFSTSITSCSKKTVTVHDTTTIIVRDTVTIQDTVVINDTLGNLSDGLVAYYNFNNGNLNDSSGNGNNITFNNATLTADRFGNANNAYLFDGSTSYMEIKNSTSLNPTNNITIYAIVKVYGFNEASCHGNQILSKGYPYNTNGFYNLAFFAANNGIGGCSPTVDTTQELFDGSYGDDNPQGSNAGVAGNSTADSIWVQKYQWYTLVYTYDGATAKFYVNGALAKKIDYPSGIPFTPNSNDLFIGKHENPAFPYFFNGVIDEVRIYNKAITDQQVGYLSILKDKYLKFKGKLIY